MSKTMIGSCSSAGRNLKTKRSSAAGKTLATTCKTKKAAAKTASKPATKSVVKKTVPKPVVKKVTPKPVAKKDVVMVKPKKEKTTTKKSTVDKVFLTSISVKGAGRVGMFRVKESVLDRLKRDAPRIEAEKIQELSPGTSGNSFDEITAMASEVYFNS
jgi:hypothetical protein